MYSRKLLLVVIIIITLLTLTGCSSQLPNPGSRAEDGVIDLVQLQFENDVIQLNGEWEFYWNQLIDPHEIDADLITGYISIPSSWNNYKTDAGTISGDGYATFRLTFMTDAKDRLALKIPRMRTAYKLWANGELIATAGTVGKSIDTTTPQYLPQVAFLDAQQGNNEIVIQVSNFHHRSGGILESIKLGSEKQIHRLRYIDIARDLFIFGCSIFMGGLSSRFICVPEKEYLSIIFRIILCTHRNKDFAGWRVLFNIFIPRIQLGDRP